MYVAADGGPDYEDFLNFVGERITLKGYKGYRAGLDVVGKKKKKTKTNKQTKKTRIISQIVHC